MDIRRTKIWLLARAIRQQHIKNKHYRSCKKMNTNQYEKYLSNRYFEMMNRYEHSKPYAHFIDFSNPQTYTEKLQWLKLYDQDPRKTILADKYLCRDYVKNKIGGEHLVDLVSIKGKCIFTHPKEIDFALLPEKYVIKCTHGSHMNVIITNNGKLNKKEKKIINHMINKWMKTNYAFCVGMELQYKDMVPHIIIEKYLEHEGDLPDYKFFCFNGDVKFFSVNENRFTEEYTETYYDLNGNKLPFVLGSYKSSSKKPEFGSLNKMIELATILSQGFKFVRVDLFQNEGKIYFGELTFSPGAGFEFPNPYYYDEKLSELVEIDLSIRNTCNKYRD